MILNGKIGDILHIFLVVNEVREKSKNNNVSLHYSVCFGPFSSCSIFAFIRVGMKCKTGLVTDINCNFQNGYTFVPETWALSFLSK